MPPLTTDLQQDLDPRLKGRYLVFLLRPQEDASQFGKRSPEREPKLAEARLGAWPAEGSDSVEQVLSRPETRAADGFDSINLPKLRRDAEADFLERIQKHLQDDREDVVLEGGVVPSKVAIDKCLALARLVAPRIALAPRLKSAAFVEEAGTVSLVLQSLVTDRRLNYRVSTDGGQLSVTRIDEAMDLEELQVSIDDANTLRELAGWVTTRV
jgi:hypothetical protein